jgi:PPP family 3-phenylpropionic acid transporter
MPLAEATTFGHVHGDTGRYARIRLWGSVGFIIAVIGIGYFLDVASMQSWLWLVIGIYACALVAIVSRAWLARHPSRESSSP